jgi:hypothetical protein
MKFTLNNLKWGLESAPINITTHSSNLSKDGNDVQFKGEIPTMSCVIEKMEFEFSFKDLFQMATTNHTEEEKAVIQKLKDLIADLKEQIAYQNQCIDHLVEENKNTACMQDPDKVPTYPEVVPIVKVDHPVFEKKEEVKKEDTEEEPLW